MNDYWREAVSIALDEAGVHATPEQIDDIAGDIEVSHENYGMAMGHDVISSPVESEKDRQIANLKREIQELEGDINIYRQSVARRRGVHSTQVYLEKWGPGKGDVMINPR